MSVKDDTVGSNAPDSLSLLRCLWTEVEPSFKDAAADKPLPNDAAAPAVRREQPIERFSAQWTLPAAPPSLCGHAKAAQQIEETEDDSLSFHWVGETLRHVGTVIHQLLHRIAEDGVSQWTGARLEQRISAFRAALASLGVPGTELSRAADRVHTALTRTLESERGRWLLSDSHREAGCEVALAGSLDGKVVGARIDRTFVDDQGTRWVIDYKSSSHEGADVDAFLDNERERYRGQLDRYRRLFLALERLPFRAALYFPLLDGWREL